MTDRESTSDGASPEELERYRMTARSWLSTALPGWKGRHRDTRGSDRGEYFASLRAWQRLRFDAGFAGITWPREYGGQELSPLHQAVYLEESAQAGPPLDVNLVGTGIVGPMLLRTGTEEQRRRFLRPILTGEEIWCQGFSEPGSGSDLASMTTKATAHGDHYVASGQKIWTSYSAFSDYMILLARTDPGAPRHRGITAFIVPMSTPGITVRPIAQINGNSDFSEVFLDSVVIPGTHVIGAPHQGWQIAMSALAHERLATTRAFEAMALTDYLAERGRNAALPAESGFWSRLAELGAWSGGSRAQYLLDLERRARTGVPDEGESASKAFTNQLMRDLSDLAATWLSSDVVHGEATEFDHDSLGHEFLTSQKYTIASGTGEVLRNLIGERVLGLPR